MSHGHNSWAASKTGAALVFAMWMFVVGLAPVGAQDPDAELADLSLAELINYRITTASRKLQTISEAPAIVSVLTRADIENLGVQTLPEVMRYVPGFIVEDVYWRGPIVTARGVAMTLYNDKILMLIDGVPAYDAVTLEYYLDVVPLTAIDRIEIIRGPGSTLYGTNAFSAVINVITRAADSGPEMEVYLKGGSYRTRGLGFTFAESQGDFSYRISATMTDNDGWNHTLPQDENGITGIRLNYENDITNIHARLDYRDLHLTAGYFFQNIAKFSMTTAIAYGSNQVPGAGMAEHSKYYLNAKYDFEFSQDFDGQFTFHYDEMDKETGVGEFGSINLANALLGDETYPIDLSEIDPAFAPPNFSLYDGRLYNAEFQLAWSGSESLEIMAGINAELRDVSNVYTMLGERGGQIIPTHEGSTELPPDTALDIGAFVQFDGTLSEKLGYIAGLRFSHLDISQTNLLTPRLGVVYNFSESMSAKLLYAEAYRGPGFQEQYFRVHGVAYGAEAAHRNLEPEKIRTLEAALDLGINEGHVLRINGFALRTEDLILRRPIAGTVDAEVIGHDIGLIYDNFGEQQIWGFELEARGNPSERHDYFANISYRDGEDRETGRQLPYFVSLTANIGASFKWGEGWSIYPNVQYVGSQDGRLGEGTLPPYEDHQKVEVDAYTLVNATISHRLSDNLAVRLIGRNLFDEEYFYPERVRRFIPRLPGGPGRSFFVQIDYTMR